MKIFFEMKTQSIFELRDARKLIRQGKRVLFTTGVIEKSAKALLQSAGVIYWERMPRALWRKAKAQNKGLMSTISYYPQHDRENLKC